MKTSTRVWLRIAVVAFWLATMAWLVRREAFPGRFRGALPGYRGLFSKEVLVMDSWMKILFKDKPIGFSHTTLDINETDPLARYLLDSRIQMKMKLLGETQSMTVNVSASLDMMYKLQKFDLTVAAPAYNMSVSATRSRGQEFDIVTRTGAATQRRAMTIPDEVVLYSPMMEMAMKNLKPGQEISVRTLDPMSLSMINLTIRAIRREPLSLGDKTHDATVLSSEYLNMSVLSWINPDGVVLRQETPFGWTMEACTIEEAYDALGSADQAEDLLTGMAVRCQGVIRNPRTARALRLKLSGVAFSRSELETNRQKVESLDGTDAQILVVPARLPSHATSEPLPPKTAPFLDATPFIQSDHPAILSQARKIVGDAVEPVEKARRLLAWVDTKVEDKMTISVPSALDVLHTLRGDCNEHTYLFVALARAAGLPAKVKVGLAYHENKFFYHAWATVYLGSWVEMDPTWGQTAVDASHIALVEGEMADQLHLMKVIGKLSIEVLDEIHAEDNENTEPRRP